MDFGFSEEQEMLRQSARTLLEKECQSAVVRRVMESVWPLDVPLKVEIATGATWADAKD